MLVDEIDTGLHHSVMTNMWNLIARTAKDLNIQVFATTHSYDCVTSLAELSLDPDNKISVQRIESGNTEAVPYTEREIHLAVKHGAEMR